MRFSRRKLLAWLAAGGIGGVLHDMGSTSFGQERPKDKEPGRRGPGRKGPATDFLQLPVPRTIDLTHVRPEYFAAALGKDPQRIFDFVRDHVGFEVYAGCLRGPRGTLLAMAGNAIDRAALLADLLQKSACKVRFVRGTLADEDARELVLSMAMEQAQPVPTETKEELAPALKAARDTLMAGIKRDYQLIGDHLQKVDRRPAAEALLSLDALVKETQPHFWVQWFQDSKWVDLDPSFGDAVPGQTHAKAEATFTTLPDSLYHRVTIRLHLEECAILLTGDADAKPTKREILRYTAKAADLSGVDLVLNHQPENWKGAAKDLTDVLATVIEDTGRLKPVLVIGHENAIAGEPFRTRLPTGKGLGGVGDLFGGAGMRTPAAMATAESLEFEFLDPAGRKEVVVREIFDLAGKARRAAGKTLTAEEVRQRTNSAGLLDISRRVFALFFTTGCLAPAHLAGIATDKPTKEKASFDVRTALRRLSSTFATTSDGMLAQLGNIGRSAIRFYPDSPRLHIAEWSGVGGKARIVLDLRRDHARAVALGTATPEDVFMARVLRGVVDGTLERVLVDFIAAGVGGKELPRASGLSTSRLFECAQKEGVPSSLLTGGSEPLDGALPEEIRARVRAEWAAGNWVLLPHKGITLDQQVRLAWWRIHPTSGETIAVTDEGLYQAAVEWRIVHVKLAVDEFWFITIYVGGEQVTFEVGAYALAQIAGAAMQSGWLLRAIVHRS